MPLTGILSVQVRPDRVRLYEELVQDLTKRAIKQKETFHWTAHQTVFGDLGALHFVTENADFAAIAARGNTQELIQRVLGAEAGAKALTDMLECTMSQRQTLSADRLDLSYPPDAMDRIHPAAVVTQVQARAGGQDAVEELIRKIAEAIPKVDDPSRIVTYQVMLGTLGSYWTLRPFEDMSELDDQLSPADLLNKAFGAAEGGLIYRTGIEAIERVSRQIVMYREDLSNPG